MQHIFNVQEKIDKQIKNVSPVQYNSDMCDSGQEYK